jgi:hypothetical protein
VCFFSKIINSTSNFIFQLIIIFHLYSYIYIFQLIIYFHLYSYLFNHSKNENAMLDKMDFFSSTSIIWIGLYIVSLLSVICSCVCRKRVYGGGGRDSGAAWRLGTGDLEGGGRAGGDDGGAGGYDGGAGDGGGGGAGDGGGGGGCGGVAGGGGGGSGCGGGAGGKLIKKI